MRFYVIYNALMIQLTIEDDLKLTGSEQLTLASRGYKMIKKVNEGSYAKVSFFFSV